MPNPYSDDERRAAEKAIALAIFRTVDDPIGSVEALAKLIERFRAMFITYKVHYATSQFEPTTQQFSNIVAFTDELTALRYANEHGLKVTELYPGMSLEDAI